MTFDKWIDAVDAQVRAQLGGGVQTEELSWDSAMWVGPAGTVVAALDDDGTTAVISSDHAARSSFAYADVSAVQAGETIAARLAPKA